MIVFIEGPRHSGKTFLLNKFFEQNSNPNIEYYKWYLVDWIKTLKLEDRETYADVHYLSLGNILTILDQMKIRTDKILVFDRAIFTAYIWAILRQRLPVPRCMEELRLILKSDVYQNCVTIFVDPNPEFVRNSIREKDMWDDVADFDREYDLMDELMLETRTTINDPKKGNRFIRFHNEFNEVSVESFVGLLDSFADLINT